MTTVDMKRRRRDKSARDFIGSSCNAIEVDSTGTVPEHYGRRGLAWQAWLRISLVTKRT